MSSDKSADNKEARFVEASHANKTFRCQYGQRHLDGLCVYCERDEARHQLKIVRRELPTCRSSMALFYLHWIVLVLAFTTAITLLYREIQ
jgi:hypothetical protein